MTQIHIVCLSPLPRLTCSPLPLEPHLFSPIVLGALPSSVLVRAGASVCSGPDEYMAEGRSSSMKDSCQESFPVQVSPRLFCMPEYNNGHV